MSTRFIIFFVVIYYGCSVSRDISGKYASKRNASSFQFKTDSTFLYEYKSFHLYAYSSGKWEKKSKKVIILNSDTQSTQVPLLVQQNNLLDLRGANHLSFNVTTKGDFGVADYKCEIFINDTLFRLTDHHLSSTGMDETMSYNEINISNPLIRYIRCDSLSDLWVATPIHSIYLKFVQSPLRITSNAIALEPLQSNKFFPPISVGNNISIEVPLNDSLFFYKVFKNEKIKLRKNGVMLFNKILNQWQKISKVPDTANIFINNN